MNDNPIIALEQVDFAYTGRAAPRPVFNGLSFVLRPGERIGLHGSNGTGKTTFFRLLMGLEKPRSGRLLFHGAPVTTAGELHRLRCAVGYVMQNADDQLFSPTVLEDVAFGPLNLGLPRDEARDRAMQALESTGLAGLAGRATHRLSGGEKKLVSIASVLSMHPEALLLDEPTAFLDDASRERMLEILGSLHLARIIISHDREFLQKTATAFVTVRDGALTERTPALPPLPGCCQGHTH